MKNIALVGNSLAVYAAVKLLLDRDASLGITLLSSDGQLPYDRMCLPGLIDRSVKEKEIFCAGADFYKSAHVQLVLDSVITRINFSRNRIFCSPRQQETGAGKVQVDFDILMMADVPDVRLPPLKGVRREGVFHIATLSAVKDLIRYLPFTETVVIEPLGFAGIRAALALKSIGKEVIIASRQELLLSNILSPGRSGMLARALESRGIRVIFSGGMVEDIIGEREVKALRLKTGKVIACDMVVLEDVVPDVRFLEGTEIDAGDRIAADAKCRASLPGVYAMDVVARIDALGFTGGYWVNTRMGVRQAGVAVASLFQ